MRSSTASFTVHVKGASEQLTALRTAVQSATTGGLRNGLTSELDDAISGVAAGNTNNACGALTDFTGLAQAQSGKSIPAATAQQFVADATRIKAVIGCKKVAGTTRVAGPRPVTPQRLVGDPPRSSSSGP